jgi:hypothetical protein
MPNNKPQPTNSQFILYQDDNGVTNVNVRFDGQDVWLSQQQIALLFDTTRENIVQHIRNIYQEAELQEERTCKNYLQVQTEGNRSVKRNIPNYNLDMIISIGYRVRSQVATRFDLVAKIAEKIGELKCSSEYSSNLQLRKINRLCSILSSLAIDNNMFMLQSKELPFAKLPVYLPK